MRRPTTSTHAAALSVFRLVAEFPANFLKAYIGRRHALRGIYGFMTAMNYAFYRYLRVAKHWERRLQRRAWTEAAPPPQIAMAAMAEVALVTGGARQIGRAIVEKLGEAGYAVAIHHGGSLEDAEALARKLEAAGARTCVLGADLVDPAEVATLIPAAEAALGPVTLLVNNAASFIADDVRSLDIATWNRQFSINLRAPSQLVGIMAERLPADAKGAVVNIVDQRVWKLTPQYYSYTLTKAALLTATQTLAQALAPRIRVNAVGPGPTFPNAYDGADRLEQEAAGTLLGHRVVPDEIAEAVLYLARASSVTGQMIAVDAGQHLGWRTPDIVG